MKAASHLILHFQRTNHLSLSNAKRAHPAPPFGNPSGEGSLLPFKCIRPTIKEKLKKHSVAPRFIHSVICVKSIILSIKYILQEHLVLC